MMTSVGDADCGHREVTADYLQRQMLEARWE